ncbi:hypothetical protein L7F22_007618 [Adiantum nelumboides]|nr:hypothetical protein [Adiantum nelumboides]
MLHYDTITMDAGGREDDTAAAPASATINPAMLYTVQHLIEKCLLLYMDREECVACLQSHAGLKPAITRIVWDELEKCNADFFAAYWIRHRKELLIRRRQQAQQPPHSADCKEN